MTTPRMSVERFDSLTSQDFKNGAVRDEIRATLAAAANIITRLTAQVELAQLTIANLRRSIADTDTDQEAAERIVTSVEYVARNAMEQTARDKLVGRIATALATARAQGRREGREQAENNRA